MLQPKSNKNVCISHRNKLKLVVCCQSSTCTINCNHCPASVRVVAANNEKVRVHESAWDKGVRK